MNQIKIGKFISECRKKENLTQLELAKKLNVTDRAISKWENGRGMPDASLMISLCDVLKISVNDLLCGEIVSQDNDLNQEVLLEIIKEKQYIDKKLLVLESVIGIFSMIILLGFVFTASFVEMEEWLRVVLCFVGLLIAMIGVMFALRLEQMAGYYECNKCNYKYIPTFKSVLSAMHTGRTRYMRCPKCGKKSWHKKVIEKPLSHKE